MSSELCRPFPLYREQETGDKKSFFCSSTSGIKESASSFWGEAAVTPLQMTGSGLCCSLLQVGDWIAAGEANSLTSLIPIILFCSL